MLFCDWFTFAGLSFSSLLKHCGGSLECFGMFGKFSFLTFFMWRTREFAKAKRGLLHGLQRVNPPITNKAITALSPAERGPGITWAGR
jgi:hypothetical protein